MLKEYPEYKETGLLWCPIVPKHWNLLRNKNVFIPRKELVENRADDFDLLSLTKQGVIVRDIDNGKGKFPKDFETYLVVNPDDIIFCLFDIDETPRTVGLSKNKGMITGAYDVFSIKNVQKEFVYYYYLFLDNFKLLKPLYSGLRKTIKPTLFLSIKLPIPPIFEQNAIVKYLDYKTKQIDEFVSAKENEIESLQELKKSLVADAVTKGISGEELVDSGIEWLPKVPKGCAVHTLRHLLKAFSEKNHSEMQLLSVTRELGVIVRDVEDTESNHNFIPDDLSNYKMVKKGQFVINKMKAWQGSYGVSDFDGIVSPAYFIFDLDFENKEFFHLAIRSRKYADFFARYSDGIRIGQWDLSMLDMKNIPFFVPPIEEQEKIVKYCKDKVRNIDTLITSIQKQVTLVKELRAKIIADVVTGKIDVREAV